MKTNKLRINRLLEAMAAAGVVKIVGRKMEHGRFVPLYDIVAPEDWSPEAMAFMRATEEDIPHLIAKYPKANR